MKTILRLALLASLALTQGCTMLGIELPGGLSGPRRHVEDYRRAGRARLL